jgi:hypothetical protein
MSILSTAKRRKNRNYRREPKRNSGIGKYNI